MLPRLPARLAILSLVVLTSASSAGDWPRFRGPNGSGVSDDKNIPVQWTPKDVAWKVPIPGLGNGSPIVSKGRVFVHTAVDLGEHSYKRMVLGTLKTWELYEGLGELRS